MLRLGLFYPNAPSIHVLSGEVARLNPDVRELANHVEVARAAEQAGFDSIWLGDHLLYDLPHCSRGPWEVWTALAGLASVTARVELGPFVASTSFHAPAMLAKLAATVDDLRAILAEVSSGDTVGKLNSTLTSTDQVAGALAESLPVLVTRFTEVADRADAALATVTPGSEINRQTIDVLRELRDAARSANALATTLQRRPNSIIFGR